MLKITVKWVQLKKLQKLNITKKVTRYMQMNLKDQVDLLDKATNKAIKQVDKERKGKKRNFILEWFRYVELVSKQLTKWIN
jgi:hypothetical protein